MVTLPKNIWTLIPSSSKRLRNKLGRGKTKDSIILLFITLLKELLNILT